jgi:hypothetical protein
MDPVDQLTERLLAPTDSLLSRSDTFPNFTTPRKLFSEGARFFCFTLMIFGRSLVGVFGAFELVMWRRGRPRFPGGLPYPATQTELAAFWQPSSQPRAGLATCRFGLAHASAATYESIDRPTISFTRFDSFAVAAIHALRFSFSIQISAVVILGITFDWVGFGR